MALARSVVDLSRSRQALLSVAQPALGAVIALRGLPDPGIMVLGLIAATTGFLAVFSLNDVLDHRIDAEALRVGKSEYQGFDLDTAYSRHPLARGDISFGFAATWVGVLALTSAITAYVLSPACLALFGAAVALEVLYCALRSVTWAKTFISGLMVAVGGLAGWVAVSPLEPRAFAFFAFLALWEIAGRNLPNDLSDLVADSRTGIRTVATSFGEGTAARATLVGSLLTIAVAGMLSVPLAGALVLVTMAIWAMGLPAVALLRQPTPEQAGAFFNRASLLPALALPVVIAAFAFVR